jgi:DNA-binding response OmpR family regulator
MPILNGIEVARAIRQTNTSVNPFVPIILVTGYAERARVLEARDAGITEMLVKPISAKALCSRIERVVLNPRPFIRTADYFGPDRRHIMSQRGAHGAREAREAEREPTDAASRGGNRRNAANGGSGLINSLSGSGS